MAHGYRITQDNQKHIIYQKTHDNGATTEVQMDKIGGQWLVNVFDPNGKVRIGRFETKQAARNAATGWMNNHPKGVTGGSGLSGMAGEMSDMSQSIFSGGGFQF